MYRTIRLQGIVLQPKLKRKREAIGSIAGMLIFLGGISLLVFVFSSCYEMFTKPIDQALGITKGKPLDYASTGVAFGQLLFRVILLLVMSVVGSLVASRGIHLYSNSLNPVDPPEDKAKEEVSKNS